MTISGTRSHTHAPISTLFQPFSRAPSRYNNLSSTPRPHRTTQNRPHITANPSPHPPLSLRTEEKYTTRRAEGRGEINNSLLINVLTLLIRFTSFPFTLAPSFADAPPLPNDGSLGVLPHPTGYVVVSGDFFSPFRFVFRGLCTCLMARKERRKRGGRKGGRGKEEGRKEGRRLLRARNRSSERTATALTRRIDTRSGDGGG